MFFYGLELTQVEVGVELDCDQSTAKRRRDRCLKQLVKDLHTKIFQVENLSVELLDSILDRLKLIYEDLYAELLLTIFELIVDDVNSVESSIADLFIDRIERQWQFNFKPTQMGLAKATAFITLRSPQVSQVAISS